MSAIFLVLAAGCEGESKTSTISEGEPSTTTSNLKPLTREYITELSAKRINDPQLVRSVSITDTGSGNEKNVSIEIIRTAVCHDGAVVGTVASFSQNLMKLLFRYPEVANVEVTLYGTTQDPASNNEIAVKVSVDRNTAQKIDWFALNDANLPKLASSFYIDARIQANWQVEGGDSTPRSQQTQTTTVSAP